MSTSRDITTTDREEDRAVTVTQAIRSRKSVRSFENKQIEPEKIQRVMEAARLAPSARNLQEWRFVLVSDPEKRREIGEAAGGQRFVGQAPVVILACAETDHRKMSCGHVAYLLNVAIALDHITLAAVAEGLGTCWVGAFDPDRVRRITGIPSSVEVVEIMPIGYPTDPRPVQKSRLDYDQIVKENSW